MNNITTKIKLPRGGGKLFDSSPIRSLTLWHYTTKPLACVFLPPLTLARGFSF